MFGPQIAAPGRTRHSDIRRGPRDIRPRHGDIRPGLGDIRPETGDSRRGGRDSQKSSGDTRRKAGDTPRNASDRRRKPGDLRRRNAQPQQSDTDGCKGKCAAAAGPPALLIRLALPRAFVANPLRRCFQDVSLHRRSLHRRGYPPALAWQGAGSLWNRPKKIRRVTACHRRMSELGG
jgi:hypothetical protein